MRTLYLVISLTAFFFSHFALAEESAEKDFYDTNSIVLPDETKDGKFHLYQNIRGDVNFSTPYEGEGAALFRYTALLTTPWELPVGEVYFNAVWDYTPRGGISGDFGDRQEYLVGVTRAYSWLYDTVIDAAAGYVNLYELGEFGRSGDPVGDAGYVYIQISREFALPMDGHSIIPFLQINELWYVNETFITGGDTYLLGVIYYIQDLVAGGDLTMNAGVSDSIGELGVFSGLGLSFDVGSGLTLTIPQISTGIPLGDSEERPYFAVGFSVGF